MKIRFLFLLLIFISEFVYCQEAGMKNYTTYDGLPSDEVFKGLLAKNGYMWFATDDGVSRFDGDVFTNYEIADGLTENTIIDMVEDKDGRIWFVGISGRLSYFENEKITPFKYNDVLIANKATTDLPSSGLIVPVSTNEVILSLFSGKTLCIKDGDCISYDTKNDSVPISNKSDDYTFYIKMKSKDTISFSVIFDSIPYTVEMEAYGLGGHSFSRYLYLEFPDKIIYFYQDNAIIIYKTRTHKVLKLSFIPISAIQSVEKGVWIGTYKNGILYFKDDNYNKEARLHLLNNQFVTSIMYDQNNRGWVSTSFGGIFNIQSLEIINYYKKGRALENYVSKIVRLDEHTFVFFGRSNKIFISKGLNEPLEELEMTELKYQLVYQAKLYNDKVLLGTNGGVLIVPIEYFTNPKHPKQGIFNYKIRGVKDFLIQDSVLWIGSSSGLYYDVDFLINGQVNHQKMLSSPKRVVRLSHYYNTSCDTSYSYLLVQDIERIEKIRYKKDTNNVLTIDRQINDVEQNSINNNDILVRERDHTIFLATKGDGIHILANDSLIVFNEKSGLLSNTVNVLKMPLDSLLFVGTNKGLNILKLSNDEFPQIRGSKYITIEDGLKGNEIHDISFYHQYVLVSTNMGLSYVNFHVVTKMKDDFPVYITKFIVNGNDKQVDTINQVELSYSENNLQIQFDAIDFHDKKGISYYYRLIGAERSSWKEIYKNSVIYPELKSGAYTFQVRAKNSYGFSSRNIASVHFYIDEIFYRTNWFKLGLVLLILLILTSYFYLHFRQRNQQLRNKNILADYQQKSLMRVMNPHFIFNLLNSVNSFIVNNKKREATLFVSQIASLIRQIFNNAADDTISVADEMALLDSYLKLEQRRLNYVFDYMIKADDDLLDMLIPSFMIQVFVENSVWHGFSHNAEKGSLLSVDFIKMNNYILCEITDNGIGRLASAENKKGKSTKREKHGIDVIKERISLLNERYDVEEIKLEIIDAENKDSSHVIGTIVRLQFPYITKD